MRDCTIEEIEALVADCEEFILEDVSSYAKEQAKIHAYNEIARAIQKDKEAKHE